VRTGRPLAIGAQPDAGRLVTMRAPVASSWLAKSTPGGVAKRRAGYAASAPSMNEFQIGSAARAPVSWRPSGPRSSRPTHTPAATAGE
jgi:hypothetical protein